MKIRLNILSIVVSLIASSAFAKVPFTNQGPAYYTEKPCIQIINKTGRPLQVDLKESENNKILFSAKVLPNALAKVESEEAAFHSQLTITSSFEQLILPVVPTCKAFAIYSVRHPLGAASMVIGTEHLPQIPAEAEHFQKLYAVPVEGISTTIASNLKR